MQTYAGELRKTLERQGVVFVKNSNTAKWSAMLDNEEIGRHSQLGVCVKQAAEAVGEK